MKYCSKCGSEFNAGSKFCDQCGHQPENLKVGEPAQAETTPVEISENTKKIVLSKSKTMKTLSILSIILSAIFFIWYLLFITSIGISKEEFSLVGAVFGLWCIAFSIVATVNSFRNSQSHNKT
ncbi:hypothetical protein [Lacinutrix sp.]|jgi:uncharacterized membrane protein YvbJ|uniref:hypothetical protein n=1 Tax=Lacinutrix sp. TaxID=1937692 RepID=UPI002639A5B0|nr:hypothetical protein [Lacinutrix sp.]MDG1715087.1 hypothetical protein [Lacinutrix sp.]